MDIIIADDSLMFRSALSSSLSEIEGFKVIEKFRDGQRLVDYFVAGGGADVVVLDLEMPILDGLSALVEIRKINKRVKIIMFSSTTVKGAEKTMQALSAGANDFVPKIETSSGLQDSLDQITRELVPKIKALAPLGFRLRESSESSTTAPQKDLKRDVTSASAVLRGISRKLDLLCIGSSTGGPDALIKIFEKIKHTPNFPMIIVQHMPPVFTTKLASTLELRVGFKVKEAEHGEALRKGVCYIAPGDHHMRIKSVNGEYIILLDQGEKVCHVRPSVDVTLSSLAESFKGRLSTFILTGMGSDGANGAESLDQNRNSLFIQDEESSVVWGMPGAVFRKNIGAQILPLEEIGMVISGLCEKG